MNNDYAAQAARHTRRVLELSSQYLRGHSEAACETLETLWAQTQTYYDNRCDAYAGVLAAHAHTLALWHVNEAYNPEKAISLASLAAERYTEYQQSDTVRAQSEDERRTLQLYLWQTQLICAYAHSMRDNMFDALEWLQKIPAERGGAVYFALLGTVQFSVLRDYHYDPYFPSALALFQLMDQNLPSSVRHVYEEDILRSAYGFYTLYYTHGVKNSQYPVPHDPLYALHLLRRVQPVLSDEQQKTWLQETIDTLQSAIEHGGV